MRFLFYSHDGYGLGHTCRNLAIARALTELAPRASVLLATGIGRRHAPRRAGSRRRFSNSPACANSPTNPTARVTSTCRRKTCGCCAPDSC
jgi:hypothetical protein